jgi:hypothetical protein
VAGWALSEVEAGCGRVCWRLVVGSSFVGEGCLAAELLCELGTEVVGRTADGGAGRVERGERQVEANHLRLDKDLVRHPERPGETQATVDGVQPFVELWGGRYVGNSDGEHLHHRIVSAVLVSTSGAEQGWSLRATAASPLNDSLGSGSDQVLTCG